MKKLSFIFSFMLTTVFLNAQIVISEIMYNPPESGTDVYEYIEMYNAGDVAVDMTGYHFLSGVEDTFPSFMLDAGAYVIVAKNAAEFESVFGLSARQWANGALSNGGELIVLADANANPVDSVDYDDSNGWPVEADGLGSSLVLCDFTADNNTPDAWQAASTIVANQIDGIDVYANPGAASSCQSEILARIITEDMEVDENVGSINVGIEFPAGDLLPWMLTLSVNSGASTATQGVDYMFIDSTYEVSGFGTDTLWVTIPIIDDSDAENRESFTLELTSSNLAVDVLKSSIEVAILDDDTVLPDVVISEIMYNNPGDDVYEYLELYNKGANAVNMEGFNFTAGIVYTFPNVTLNSGEYMVICTDSVSFNTSFGVDVLEWSSGGLSNGGESIELRDANGNVIDFVQYDDGGDWPTEADGSGSALILCDPATDNADAANWAASMESTGVLAGGSEIFGSPGATNDCDAVPTMNDDYPVYTIGEVTVNDDMGISDSINVSCQLSGVVYGVNYNHNGLSFTIIDDENNGINVYKSGEELGYVVEEGNAITVLGTITQYNGLTEIIPDSIILDLQSEPLFDPTVVTTLDESTESQLIKIENLTIVDPTQWELDGFGFNVDVTDGTNTYTMRVDGETNVMGTAVPVGTFHLTGIGGQYDTSSPYDEGYQIFPRYIGDIDLQVGTNDLLDNAQLSIYPNPVSEVLTIESEVVISAIIVYNNLGQIQTQLNNVTSVNVANWNAGVYTFKFQTEEGFAVKRVVVK